MRSTGWPLAPPYKYLERLLGWTLSMKDLAFYCCHGIEAEETKSPRQRKTARPRFPAQRNRRNPSEASKAVKGRRQGPKEVPPEASSVTLGLRGNIRCIQKLTPLWCGASREITCDCRSREQDRKAIASSSKIYARNSRALQTAAADWLILLPFRTRRGWKRNDGAGTLNTGAEVCRHSETGSKERFRAWRFVSNNAKKCRFWNVRTDGLCGPG